MIRYLEKRYKSKFHEIPVMKNKFAGFQVDGRSLPRKRNKIFNGELTLENLRKDDHGVYECVVKNDVATIIAR